MKKNALTLFSTIILLNFANAQVSAYTFASSAGTYTSITGGTLLGDTTVDDQHFVNPSVPLGGTATSGLGFPIGFSFTYNGIVFDRLAINTNGWISLGQSSLSPSVNIQSGGVPADYHTVVLSQSSTATPPLLRNRIAGLAMDLAAQTGSELRIETIGTSPNRTCVIQWKTYRRYSFGGTYLGDLNFQIRLKETSNSVAVVYGTMTNTANIATPQVGLGGTTDADFNCRKTLTNWTYTTVGTVNTDTMRLSTTIKPLSGRTFTWSTPPPPCSGTPTAGTASATPTSVCSGDSIDLVLTGYTSNVSGLTFQWASSSTSGGTYINIAGGTTATFSTTQTTAKFYNCTVTCAASGLLATSTIVNVTMNAGTSCYCTPASNCSLDDEILKVTMATINNSTTCATGGYSSYLSPNPTLNQGSSYPIGVFVGSGGTEHAAAWIDYNQNGIFETSEYTLIGSGDSILINSTITIPSSAMLGSTMMRVRLRWNVALTAADACLVYGYGETEDYKVTITGTTTGIDENALGAISVYPNPTTGLFTITAGNANFAELTISIVDIQGKEVYRALEKNSSADFNKQINLEALAKGVYAIKLNTGSGVKIQKLIIE